MKEQFKNIGKATATASWKAVLIGLLLIAFNAISTPPSPKPVDPIPAPSPAPSPIPAPLVEAHTAPFAKLTAPAKGIVGEPIILSTAGSLGKSIKLREQGFDSASGWLHEAFDKKGLPEAVFVARSPMTLHSTLVVGQGDETDIAQVQTVFTASPEPPPEPPVDPPKPPVDPPKPTPGDAKSLIVIVEKSATSPVWKSADVTNFLKANGLPAAFEYPTSLVAPNADPIAMKWIGQSAADGNTTYPFCFVIDATGNILEKVAVPSTSNAMIALISKHLKNPVTVPLRPCQNGGCPR